MSRTLYLATALSGALLFSPMAVWAQAEKAPASPPATSGAPAPDAPPAAPAPPPPASPAPGGLADEFQRVRELLDRQTMQIEMLAREVSQLRRRLDAGGNPAPATPTGSAAPETAPAPPPPPPGEAGAPSGAAPAASAQAEIPRAEATGGGVKHIVAKGETLTSIAKNYNIAVATLQKANKIQDGRKLQIGQVLSIPTTPEPASPEKKETP